MTATVGFHMSLKFVMLWCCRNVVTLLCCQFSKRELAEFRRISTTYLTWVGLSAVWTEAREMSRTCSDLEGVFEMSRTCGHWCIICAMFDSIWVVCCWFTRLLLLWFLTRLLWTSVVFICCFTLEYQVTVSRWYYINNGWCCSQCLIL